MRSLSPILLLARAEARSRRTAIVAVVAAAMLVSVAALTAAAGARRTATVVDRMVANQDLPAFAVGTYLTTNAGDAARLRQAEEALVDLPGVDQAIAIANIFVAIGPNDGSWNLSIGTGLDGRYLDSGWAGPLRDGRLPAGDGRGEVAFDAATASRLGLRVGDQFFAPTISVETIEALMSGQASEATADGPLLEFSVVGIFRESVTDDASFGFGLASPDTAAYLGRAGVADAYFLFDGDTDVSVQAAVTAVDQAMGGGSAYVADPNFELDPVRNTVDVIAAGLALFSAIAVVAGMIALSQVVGRQVSDSGRVAKVAGALGMRDRETTVALALPSAVAAGTGVVLGAVASVALSPVFPTGLGRLAEPNPGVRIDWPVLVVGSLALSVFVAAAAVAAADRKVRARDREDAPRYRRRPVELRSGLPLSAAIGSGLVLVPNRIRSGVRPASAVLGTVLGVSGVIAIAVFTVSQRATASDPIRYGWSWDADSEITVDDPEQLFAALAEEPVLAAVGVATCGGSRIGDDDTQLCSMDVLSGSMPLTYLAGRPPASPDEVAAGQGTMARSDLSIGDRVDVTGTNGTTRSLEVVGVAVMPTGIAPGSGLVTTPEGLRSLNGSDSVAILTLSYAEGLEPEQVERILADDYGLSAAELTRASPPPLITRLNLVRPTLVGLAVFLGVLGVIGLTHFLMLSTAQRRHETAVLEAIGFVRGQMISVVVWQASTIAAIGVIVGTPLGVMLGRTAWIESVDQLGIVDTATVPVLFCAIVALAVLLGASVIGLLVGWPATRQRPSAALRQE